MQGFAKAALGVAAILLKTILGVIAGYAILGACAAVLGDSHGGLMTWLFAFVASPIFLFVVVFLHELGHAVAAWLNKWIVDKIVVYPFAYAPRKRTWSWAKGYAWRGDVFGWVETRPRAGGGSRVQETWVTLGGVIANVASAIAFLAIANLALAHVVSAVFGALAAISVVTAIFNILPWKLAGSGSDGMRLAEMWTRPAPLRDTRRKTKSQWNVPRKW